MVTIIKPYFCEHSTDSFRGLVDAWGERGYCEVKPCPVPTYSFNTDVLNLPEAKCWMGDVGDIMLYDFALLDRIPADRNWKFSLWANSMLEGERSSAWSFWPKHSKLYEEFKVSNRLSYEDRGMLFGFIGSRTTQKRTLDYKPCCDFFVMTRTGHNSDAYPPAQYLELLSKMKFGLCLPGVGPKCLRDIEYMGLGVVPVITPGCSVDHFNRIEEGVHYLKANTPEEATELVGTCSKETWKMMSDNCIEWFEKNSSIKGAFDTTMEILEKNNIGI